MVDAVAALIATGFKELDKAFRAELPLGFLNTLWAWIANRVGHPEDATLNLYSLGALLAALPSTLIYKLAIGVDHEPFPNGKLPFPQHNPMAAQTAFQMPWQCVLTSDIARMVQVIPAGASDWLASDCPGWLTAVNIAFAGSVWILRHGYPEELKVLFPALLISGPLVLLCLLRGAVWYSRFGKDGKNDIVAIGGTVAGAAALVYGIYRDARNDEYHQKSAMLIANILTPLPMLFSWLTLSPIRQNPEAKPFAILGNLVFDFVGYVDGGLPLMLDTLQTRPKTAIA